MLGDIEEHSSSFRIIFCFESFIEYNKPFGLFLFYEEIFALGDINFHGLLQNMHNFLDDLGKGARRVLKSVQHIGYQVGKFLLLGLTHGLDYSD